MKRIKKTIHTCLMIVALVALALPITFLPVAKATEHAPPRDAVLVMVADDSGADLENQEMSYITVDDLKDELGEYKLIQLTATDEAPGEIGEKRVDKAISYAVGTFDSYARTRYTLPVTVTEKVKATCLDLAVFYLVKGRASIDEGEYKIKASNNQMALKFLGDLREGKAALDVPTAEETKTNPASPDDVLKASDISPSVFSDDNLKGY